LVEVITLSTNQPKLTFFRKKGVLTVISNTTRLELFLLTILFGLLGLVLFLGPGWSAENFPWSISPMVAMTMAGWCLGNAFIAGHTALKKQLSLVYPGLLYLFLFGVFEALVLLLFRGRLVLDAPLTWPYILSLVVSILAGGWGLIEWRRQDADKAREDPPAGGVVRGLALLFVVFVAILALIGVWAPAGSFATEGTIFPEPLTLFTLRAFAAFYASLSLSAVPLIWARSLKPVVFQSWNGLALIVPITLAALVNLDRFDFAARPGGLLYLGAYLIAAAVIIPILFFSRSSMGASERGVS
jgi:hypothetical protein